MTEHSRDLAMAAISRKAGTKALLWFGIRGSDAHALLDLPAFGGSYAVTAPIGSAMRGADSVFELELGARPDLDRFELETCRAARGSTWISQLADAMSNGALVMPYRPSTLLSNIALRHQATDSVLGNPVVGHARFDYKPWVENQVARAGAPGISWTYHWRPPATHADSARAIIWRTSQTSGGVGIQLTSDMPDPALWTSGEVVASSAYLEEARPLNVSGVVYRTGALRLHPLSMQLVGIPSCTHEELGYCGNDFGAVSTLRRADLQAVEEVVTRVGRWLCSTGYVGAFGVDLLLHEDAALFVELNPRFQGSSRMSSAIAQEHGCVDIFLDHLCAALDLDPPGPPIRLDEWSDLAGARAQIVVHNTSDVPVTIRERALAASASTATTRFIDAPPEMLPVVPGGVQCRIELRDRATTSGKDLTGIAAGLVAGARAWFEPASGTPSP